MSAATPPSHDVDADENEDMFWEALQAREDQWVDEEDDEEDDDDDYEEEEEDDDDEDDEFDDAQEDVYIDMRRADPGDEDEEEGEGDGEEGQAQRTIYMSRAQIMELLANPELRRLLGSSLDIDLGGRRPMSSDSEDGEEEGDDERAQPRRRRLKGAAAYQKVPSDEGRQLMETGKFGSNERTEDTFKRKKRLAAQIMRRELGLGSHGRQRNADRLISQSKADMIIHYNARCYSGQFSRDGNFFFSCAQDFKVRMYDTSNPYDWKYYKTVEYPYGQWTITDASLSPDNRLLAYSSIRSVVCLASTDPADDSTPRHLDFTNTASVDRRRRVYPYFGIWSLRFSGDGREIVAGTGDASVYVYDIERNQSILRIPGHEDDVNAVCYGDNASPHILYSGSDDTTIKIWDRRSLAGGREAGVFFGHTEGLTYVDSKGDGRYVLSNAKDQTAKLWDLRRMMSADRASAIRPDRYTTGFEYRNLPYDPSLYRPHPHDASLVTFRGHQVLKTLIRAHFSPPQSSDSRFVYSGSHDGKVYVWNLDATLAATIDVLAATRHSRPREHAARAHAETYDFVGRHGGNAAPWQTCVRDASWHPSAPVIAATSWNGWGTSLGTCSVHAWSDRGDGEGEGGPVGGAGETRRCRCSRRQS
ncbi:WD40 repeat-like protein [Pseudovirgaria hyperparasitica]|uniref:WD40 repeat-like protein n=1 Tax=Pseudovirgaria hyperparasitica TaxID=470096 RepID=A0A6A6W600_9PEZI|nr:WD40 repeat-like protein [Pseudovirgaria hyperparasitica]KAF2757599.1 WD40 repeat-like protein [Pseudovirgaria hyperparasitica]